MAYVNFVNHCYVDTEVEMKEIYTSNHIWTLFENFTLDMALVCSGGQGWASGWRDDLYVALSPRMTLLHRSATNGRSVWRIPP